MRHLFRFERNNKLIISRLVYALLEKRERDSFARAPRFFFLRSRVTTGRRNENSGRNDKTQKAKSNSPSFLFLSSFLSFLSFLGSRCATAIVMTIIIMIIIIIIIIIMVIIIIDTFYTLFVNVNI